MCNIYESKKCLIQLSNKSVTNRHTNSPTGTIVINSPITELNKNSETKTCPLVCTQKNIKKSTLGIKITRSWEKCIKKHFCLLKIQSGTYVNSRKGINHK